MCIGKFSKIAFQCLFWISRYLESYSRTDDEMQRLDRAIQEKYEVLQAANTNYENFVKKSEVGHFSSSLSKILLLLNGTFTKTQILGKELVSFQKEQSELKQKVAELEKEKEKQTNEIRKLSSSSK